MTQLVLAFILLLAMAVVARLLIGHLLPVLTPAGRLKCLGAGWLGGLTGGVAGDLLWTGGPRVSIVNPIAALVGCLVFILSLGIWPFIRIFLKLEK